jgi:uncharacterized protein (TIGR02996 family)
MAAPVLLTCPNCRTIYTIEHVPPNVPVQCTQCSNVWVPPAQAVDALPARPARPPAHTQFLDQIDADPSNDALRLVFADYLSEQGDPRGEFIAIQIAKARGEPRGLSRLREQQLLREHFHDWVPAGVAHDSRSFHRGFLHTARLHGPTDPTHEGWRTVQRVLSTLGPHDALPSTRTPFSQRPLPNLREAHALGPHLLAGLAMIPRPALTSLSVIINPERDDVVFTQLGHFTSLTRLGVTTTIPPLRLAFGVPGFHEAFVRRFGHTLQRLRLQALGARLGPLQRQLRAEAPKLLLQLDYLDEFTHAAWIEVTASSVTACVYGEVPEVIAATMKRAMFDANLGSTLVAVDRQRRSQRSL